MDIAFGGCLSGGSSCYTLILVDQATRYNWSFGLKDLSLGVVLGAIRKFCAAAGSLAWCFYCDCHAKLFGNKISNYFINNSSKVVAAPTKCQLANRFVELHWNVMVHMARVYLPEKQMSRQFWFYAIIHAARMMNAIPRKIPGRLASCFLSVHGVGHDPCTWVPIFSLCYFHHKKDGDTLQSKHQAHTMDGIIVDSSTSNALLVYNSRNKQYYEPNSYRINSYRLPSSVYHNIKYDGGLFCHLLRDNNPPVEEPYPPETRIERVNPTSNRLLAGMVMDIPFPTSPSDPSLAPSYNFLFDDSTSASIPLLEMAAVIPKVPVNITVTNPASSLLPPFLQLNSKIPYEHDDQYHKGYLSQVNGVYCFSFKSHANKRKEEWGVPLPNLPTTWVDLCVQGILIPGHVPHSFLHSPTSPHGSTLDPLASFVSTANLHCKFPPTLLKALSNSHPDCEVWLKSYQEEINGIWSMNIY
jgi:hypothetical protein